MAFAQQTVPATGRAGPLYKPALRDFLAGRRCLGEWFTRLAKEFLEESAAVLDA
ncbi:hypothetical protein PtA15_9A269 [Puccinia triticina]|uniref:Uncharacterized protein n=1 Tax=Puccinia triticina TaxID=208348 RepID=A0ABY7CSF2_9BASI|nr:uncharacterized protein PtA15_9A269 [Puccinia triticina]WAQ88144.1 hypothetical protein PtA15_9A269 [Puccinia triticina]